MLMIKLPITRLWELLKSLYLSDMRQVKIVRQKCFPFQRYNPSSNSSPFIAIIAKCNIRKKPVVVVHMLDMNSLRVIKSVVKNLESQEDEIRSIEFHKAINIWIDRPGKYDNYRFKTYIVSLSMGDFYPTGQTRYDKYITVILSKLELLRRLETFEWMDLKTDKARLESMEQMRKGLKLELKLILDRYPNQFKYCSIPDLTGEKEG
jgi:hypothetical protein